MFDDCCPECGHLLPDSKTECMVCGGSDPYSAIYLKTFSSDLSDSAHEKLSSDIDSLLFDLD